MSSTRLARLLPVCAVVAALLIVAPAAQAQLLPPDQTQSGPPKGWLERVGESLREEFRQLFNAEEAANTAESCAARACDLRDRAEQTGYPALVGDLWREAKEAAAGARTAADGTNEIADRASTTSDPAFEELRIPEQIRQQAGRAEDAVQEADAAVADIARRYKTVRTMTGIDGRTEDGQLAAARANTLLDQAEHEPDPERREELLNQADAQIAVVSREGGKLRSTVVTSIDDGELPADVTVAASDGLHTLDELERTLHDRRRAIAAGAQGAGDAGGEAKPGDGAEAGPADEGTGDSDARAETQAPQSGHRSLVDTHGGDGGDGGDEDQGTTTGAGGAQPGDGSVGDRLGAGARPADQVVVPGAGSPEGILGVLPTLQGQSPLAVLPAQGGPALMLPGTSLFSGRSGEVDPDLVIGNGPDTPGLDAGLVDVEGEMTSQDLELLQAQQPGGAKAQEGMDDAQDVEGGLQDRLLELAPHDVQPAPAWPGDPLNPADRSMFAG